MIDFERFDNIKIKQPLLFDELVEVAILIIQYEFTPNGEYDLLSDEKKQIFQKRRNRFFSIMLENRVLFFRNRNELFEDLESIRDLKAC